MSPNRPGRLAQTSPIDTGRSRVGLGRIRSPADQRTEHAGPSRGSALVVFAVGAITMALQVWTGLIGIGLAILLFVVLGNPSAGGAYPAPLLPPFWAAIGPWLPPGAATDAVRGIVYFGGAGAGVAALVLVAYGVVGLVATLAGAGRRGAVPLTA